MKEARKLKKKRQAKLKKGKTNGGDLGSSGDSSSSGGKKERRVKVRKVKKPSVRQKVKSKRVKDGDSESDDGNVRGKTGPRRKACAKEERVREAKQAEKRKENKKGTKAKFMSKLSTSIWRAKSTKAQRSGSQLLWSNFMSGAIATKGHTFHFDSSDMDNGSINADGLLKPQTLPPLNLMMMMMTRNRKEKSLALTPFACKQLTIS